jgi:hypothetical protein
MSNRNEPQDATQYVEEDIPGRYLVTRRITVRGHPYEHEIECNNPAWGWERIREWHQGILRAYGLSGT